MPAGFGLQAFLGVGEWGRPQGFQTQFPSQLKQGVG
jgi:hypothetical protein